MSNTERTEQRGRLSGQQKTRLKKLLNMMYRPSEIAEEIGFELRQIYRVYIPLGMPHEQDKKKRIWINGSDFRDWAIETYKKTKLGNNEAYCLTCKKPIEIKKPEWNEKEGLFYLICFCPSCGRKIARIIDRKVN